EIDPLGARSAGGRPQIISRLDHQEKVQIPAQHRRRECPRCPDGDGGGGRRTAGGDGGGPRGRLVAWAAQDIGPGGAHEARRRENSAQCATVTSPGCLATCYGVLS